MGQPGKFVPEAAVGGRRGWGSPPRAPVVPKLKARQGPPQWQRLLAWHGRGIKFANRSQPKGVVMRKRLGYYFGATACRLIPRCEKENLGPYGTEYRQETLDPKRSDLTHTYYQIGALKFGGLPGSDLFQCHYIYLLRSWSFGAREFPGSEMGFTLMFFTH